MLKFTAYSKNQFNDIKDESIKVLDIDGVCAIYADSITREHFDSEEAVCVKIEPSDEIESILSICKESAYWTKPAFATSFGEVPTETQGLFCKKKDGTFLVIVPVVGEEFKTELIGKDDALYSKTYSWYDRSSFCDELLFVYAEGDNLFKLIKSCFKVAAELLGNRCRLREEKDYPEFLEYLGWCSWDSMQIRVNEDGLKEKCEEFKSKNIPVKWAIIDDMWAEVRDFYGQEYADFKEMVDLMHRSKLYSYEADPIRFPNGLKHTVKMINEYGIDVGMWYPTTGYWAGLDKDGDAYKEVGQYTLVSNENAIVPDYNPEKAYMYYKKIFEFFRSAGVQFVKVDNQAMPKVHYKGMAPIGVTARGSQSGIEAAVGECFAGKLINCMGMASEAMWNRGSSAVSRCSNDFMPENRKWFRKHILQCTYNGLTQGQLYYNDFDMWWTDDEQARKNSLLRAVSGGPIYVSDKIGRSNKEIFDPLVLNDGKILRCDRPGVPTVDCLFDNPRKSDRIFKVQNIAGEHGVIAVFNLDDDEQKSLKGTVSPKDVDGLADGKYAIYEHFSRELKIVSYDEHIDVTLENADDFKLFIIVPLKDGFGVIGRIDKYISPKTVEYVYGENIVLKEDGPYAYIKDNKLIIKE